MNPYHKIQTVYKRDSATGYKTLLLGEYSCSEFEYLKNIEWVFSEKIDGTNIRVIYSNGEISFGGRTERAEIPTHLLDALNTTFLPLKDKFSELFNDKSVCLYGEGYGNKIQSIGHLYRQDNSFILFDIKVNDVWLLRDAVEDIAKILNIEVVPIIATGSLDVMVGMVEDGFGSYVGANMPAEGIVARPYVELLNRKGERIITKIKSTDFL